MKSKKTKLKINKITKKIKFSELIEKYPESIEILLDNGMHCFGCAMASFETLEQGCIAHGLNPDEIVVKINNKLEKRKK
jgi:hybrid cluster-associated redox disulfide protein